MKRHRAKELPCLRRKKYPVRRRAFICLAKVSANLVFTRQIYGFTFVGPKDPSSRIALYGRGSPMKLPSGPASPPALLRRECSLEYGVGCLQTALTFRLAKERIVTSDLFPLKR